MIIDNVDNAHEFFESQLFGKAMHQYVPHSPNGSILYTTRNRDIAVDLVSDRDPIQIDCLTLEEADQLLDRYLCDAGTSEERQGLFQALGFLPLAITQAVAFMAKRRKTIAQYLELFEKNTIAKARLLTYEFSDHGREARALDSVARTWIVSFDLIKSTQPRAADLLSLMSFLDPQSIHPSLLLDDGEDEWDLSDALETLVAFSLIKINESDGTYSMHCLVQVVTCSWLLNSNAGDYHRFALQTLSMFAERFPRDVIMDTAAIMYIPHADKVLSSETQKLSMPYQLSQATLLHKTAKYYSRSGHLVIAEARARTAHDLRIEFLGQFHPDTVLSLITLGWINNRLCRYHVAQEVVEPVLHVLIKDGTFPIGPMRRVTNILAQALISQKQLEFAEQLVRKVMPDHMIDGFATDSLQSPPSGNLEGYRLIATLGKIHLRKGDFKKAEDYYQKALILHETAFEKHPTDDNDIATQTTMGNIRNGTLIATEGLALVLSHQNRSSQAESSIANSSQNAKAPTDLSISAL